MVTDMTTSPLYSKAFKLYRKAASTYIYQNFPPVTTNIHASKVEMGDDNIYVYFLNI